jgi:hypothetical protein
LLFSEACIGRIVVCIVSAAVQGTVHSFHSVVGSTDGATNIRTARRTFVDRRRQRIFHPTSRIKFIGNLNDDACSARRDDRCATENSPALVAPPCNRRQNIF